MTDLDMTRLCAEAMGYDVKRMSAHWGGLPAFTVETGQYSPLHNDEQAMAMVKRLGMHIIYESDLELWHVAADAENRGSRNKDLNRAIVECVAKMKEIK